MYTFSDEVGHIYTVINLPPLIMIPNPLDPNIVDNKEIQDMLQLLYLQGQVPEAPFLFHRCPVRDPILSHFCLDNKVLQPIQFNDCRWGLPAHLTHEWKTMENGLWFISQALFDKAAENPVIASFMKLPYWPEPHLFGYRDLHTSYTTAQKSILCSRDAFMLRAAHCSFALLLWLLATAQNTGDNINAAGKVPSTWVDLFQQSVITDLSPVLRIRAF
ncbi:hypothetical protein V8D89_001502 [Ganoderma adspersum]